MDQGTCDERSGKTDNGIASQPTYVFIPPKPPLPMKPSFKDDDTDTPPLGVELPDASSLDADAQLEIDVRHSDYALMRKGRFRDGISEDGEYLRTHRHWREPWLRVLRPQTDKAYEENMEKWKNKKANNPVTPKRPPQRYGPAWYFITVYVAFVVMVICAVALANITDPNVQGPVFLIFLVASGAFAYSIGREVYRWRRRTILMRHTETGLRITWGEPDNGWLLFNGTRDGHVENIEGSNSLTPLRSWPDKYIFLGCGDLEVSSKVESTDLPLLQNIPHYKKVHKFLSRIRD